MTTILQELSREARPSSGEVRFEGGRMAWTSTQLEAHLGVAGSFVLREGEPIFVQLSRSGQGRRSTVHLRLRNGRGDKAFLCASTRAERVSDLPVQDTGGASVPEKALLQVLDALRVLGAEVADAPAVVAQHTAPESDSMGELEVLAAQETERQQREAQRIEKKRAAEQERAASDEPDEVLVSSLQVVPMTPLFVVLVFAFPFLGLMFLEHPWMSWVPGWVKGISLFAGFFLAFLSGFLLIERLERVLYRFELKRLHKLGVPMDMASYTRAMSKKQGSAKLKVRVKFEKPVPRDKESLVRNAVRGALKEPKARFEGDDLMIVSPRLQCSSSHKGNTSYANDKLHRWWRRCAKRAIPPIQAQYPIDTITFFTE